MNNGLMNGNKMDQRPSSSVIASSTTTLKTLKGLFDEPKMNHRRDFLRENKLSLKELQRATTGKILHSKQEAEKRTPWRKTQTKTQEIPGNVRRSFSHQRVSGNDENRHNHQHLSGGCCVGDKNHSNDVYRRSRSYIQNSRNDCTATTVTRNGCDRNQEFHCCCNSAQSCSSGNNKAFKVKLRDQEIQTEDIYDEQFLYEALKKCSTNDVKNRLLDSEAENRIGGGEDTASICEQSVHQYNPEHEVSSHSNNNYSPRCPSERDLSQHNQQLDEKAADTKSTRSYRSQDNASIRSIQSRVNGGGSKCGGGDNLDNKSLHTIYAADNRNRSRYNQAADGDNISQCPSTSTVHRSKLSNTNLDNNHQHQLGSIHSQQEHEHIPDDYQVNGGGDGNISTHPHEYPDEGPPSHRSRHSSVSQISKKTVTSSNSKLGGRDEARDVRLPRYLEKEKRAKEEELQRQATRDPNCPFGHYAMDDDLRVQHLIKAQRRMSELIQELNRMPMTTETLRLRARKNEIEKELQQIESDIRVYSKPKVYLPIPAKSTTKYEYYNNYSPAAN